MSTVEALHACAQTQSMSHFTNVDEIRTCSIQKIHVDTLASLRGFGRPNGRKKLVTYPRNLSLGVLVIGGLHILDGRLVLHLTR
jgi:hypothetical protein